MVVREQEQMLLETLLVTPDEVVGGSPKHLSLTTLAASTLGTCPLQSHWLGLGYWGGRVVLLEAAAGPFQSLNWGDIWLEEWCTEHIT